MVTANLLERRVKRSEAGAMLARGPRTLRRYEQAGLLTPIKLNARSVVYTLREVLALAQGEGKSVSTSDTVAVTRGADGRFSRTA